MNINKNVQGHLFALTANVMWGLMAPIGKFALQEFSALCPHFSNGRCGGRFLDSIHFL